MNTRRGFIHAAVLALSTMLLPDGLSSEGGSSPEFSRDTPPPQPQYDGSDDDADDSDDFSAFFDACKRNRQRQLNRWRGALERWRAGQVVDPRQRAIHHFSLMALLDRSGSPDARMIKALVWARLCREVPGEEIVEAMTRLVLEPSECRILTSEPQLGLKQMWTPEQIRSDCSKMVREFLYNLKLDSEAET
ncbi:MAG: hypothetical protein HY291_10180 [Planctomycetes bacterium]|nr:hypothetical protein [Planctomycetota bacterium]